MKGKAETLPTNHVVWANGFKSNMPDWPTARTCAMAPEIFRLAIKMRSFLLANQECGGVEATKLHDEIHETITLAQFGPERDTPLERLKYHVTGAIERGEKVAIEAKVFPKPPGFT